MQTFSLSTSRTTSTLSTLTLLVRAGYIAVSITRGTLTWPTGSLACLCDLSVCVYTRGDLGWPCVCVYTRGEGGVEPWLVFLYAYTHGDLGLQSQPKDVVLEFDKRIKNPFFFFLLFFYWCLSVTWIIKYWPKSFFSYDFLWSRSFVWHSETP